MPACSRSIGSTSGLGGINGENYWQSQHYVRLVVALSRPFISHVDRSVCIHAGLAWRLCFFIETVFTAGTHIIYCPAAFQYPLRIIDRFSCGISEGEKNRIVFNDNGCCVYASSLHAFHRVRFFSALFLHTGAVLYRRSPYHGIRATEKS